jgi:50S ribosomal protein L16 3-hydroxylase
MVAQNKFFHKTELNNFLDTAWERKPIVIKNAIADIESFADFSDFNDMAMDEEFETRVISKNKDHYQQSEGPISSPIDFKQTEELKTLVCHSINLYDENFFNLAQAFNFVPHWMFDDIMATISTKDSNVGAHIDNYNVFILQGHGTRKWELQLKPDTTFRENTEIKLLQNFNADLEYTLEPGDMLYIPPHVAHRGTSLSPSISYSIGFKSLDYDFLVKNYLAEKIQHYDSDSFFNDQKNLLTDHPFKMNFSFACDVQAAIKNEVFYKQDFNSWLLSYLSRPRRDFNKGLTLSREEFFNLLEQNDLYKDPFLRSYYMNIEERTLFVSGGKEFWLSEKEAKMLCERLSHMPFEPLQIEDLNDEQIFVILCLVELGGLYLNEKGA